MTNIAMVFRWPINFCHGLPNLKMGGSFHGKLLNNQRVSNISYTSTGYLWGRPTDTWTLALRVVEGFWMDTAKKECRHFQVL